MSFPNVPSTGQRPSRRLHPAELSMVAAALLAGAGAAAVITSLPSRRAALLGTWCFALAVTGLIGVLGVRLRRQDEAISGTAVAGDAELRLRKLNAGSPELVVAARSADGAIVYLSPAAEAVLPRGAMPSPTTLYALVHPDDRVIVEEHVRRACSGSSTVFECRVQLPNGVRHLECRIANHERDPEIGAIVLNAVDVTERALLANSLSHQAAHDSLTGLLNRHAFLTGVDHRVGEGGLVAVVLVDIDGFKEVNDTLGHAVGDRVLTTVAARLATLVRDRDLVARLGGDEFGVMIHAADPTGAYAVARRVLASISAPIESGTGREVFLTGSCGIAVVAPGTDAATLLKQANSAVFEAKQSGGARAEMFVPELAARFAYRIEMRAEIERGLQNREFVLQFQPIHSLPDGDLVGFEALLRWQRPDGSFMNPGDFLPIAESSGQMVPLGRWIIHAALRQLAAWRAVHPTLQMSINVSPRQLGEDGFVQEVAQLLATHSIDPTAVVFEITEPMLVDNPERMASRLGALAALGVRVAVDDYGAGNAAIGFLLKFPINIVKFDRNLINALDTDRDKAEALIRSITSLAHSLQLETVAEGIERPEQLGLVAELGCSKAQGYHLARPMFPDRADRYLQAHTPALRPGT